MKLNYNHCKTKDEAYQKAKALITPDLLAKYKVSPNFVYDDANKVVKAKGSGFELIVTFFDQHLELDLNLSLILRAFKTTIMTSLERQLGKIL